MIIDQKLLRALLLVSVVWTSGVVSVLGADPETAKNEIAVTRGLRYREGTSNSWTLDLAMPTKEAGKPRPAIVVIHGGGWIEGDKSSFSTAESRPGSILEFAKLGFVAVTINYRLAKEAPFPAALQDCKCAVRWLRAHAAEYRVDADAIGAWGNSAGGHLALMLGMIDKNANLEGDGPYQEFSSRVQSVVSDSGPLDLTYEFQHNRLRGVIEQFLGGAPEGDRAVSYRLASPISHVASGLPPMMLIYGGMDNQVSVETADQFVVALTQAGAKDINYLRLATAEHCPHSLVRVRWLVPAVDEFFMRTLRHP